MSLCVARRTLPLHLPFTVKRCIFSYTAYKQHYKQVNTASCCEFNGIQNWANFYETPIGNRMRSVEWCHLNDLEWLLTQIISSASHYLRTEVEYLRNSMRHSYNEIPVATYTRPTQRCNYEWPWVILSDLTFPTTRAASLRQLSFLLVSVLKVTVLVLVMCQLYLVFRDQDRDSFKIACAIYSQLSIRITFTSSMQMQYANFNSNEKCCCFYVRAGSITKFCPCHLLLKDTWRPLSRS